MKLYAPEYYKKFRCIADRCEHSCCNGWEIDIDSATLARYKTLCLEHNGQHLNVGDSALRALRGRKMPSS